MKLSLALLATLAVSTSATPIRIITITPLSDAFLPSDEIVASLPHSHFDDYPSVQQVQVQPQTSEAGSSEARPCHGSRNGLSSILSRIGFPSSSSSSSASEESDRGSLFDIWRSLFHEAEERVAPILESGIVKISSYHTDNENGVSTISKSDKTPEIKWWRPATGEGSGKGRWEVKDGRGEWRKPRKGEQPPRRGGAQTLVHTQAQAQAQDQERPPHHHHNHPRPSSERAIVRFHRALNHLTAIEGTALALVIGIGLGSIVHVVFMLLLLSFRRIRYGCKSNNREQIRLEGGEDEDVSLQKEAAAHEEVLPAYEAEENRRMIVDEKVHL
ncbi:hypothetical protein CI109_107181 [Kwoniella shandongensis]|uniref:Uncharacterized protein n=1 Tax=Kwoniella shandongensis TaxID=1734106 RepID=A0A5M6C2A3_9TREE|nr:uncharacterized protein CI109_002464 [Kwoniella shandongensis]KAA5529123.1 hypothetical protein CI109_002464 [Kwoniella shandongensis]